MKRSKMIKKIAKFLLNKGITADPLAADIILSKIEKLGMLPPETHIDPKQGSCLCGHGEWCEYCSSFGVVRNEWEKE